MMILFSLAMYIYIFMWKGIMSCVCNLVNSISSEMFLFKMKNANGLILHCMVDIRRILLHLTRCIARARKIGRWLGQVYYYSRASAENKWYTSVVLQRISNCMGAVNPHYLYGVVHILRNQFLAFFTPLPPP